MALRGVSSSGALLAAAAFALLMGACGSSPGPNPTPLPVAQLQARYLQAANAYNTAELPVSQAENTYCTSSTAELTKCKSALNQDRQVTITFDKAIKGIPWPAAYQAGVSKLLKDDSQLEQLLQQAANASSIGADSALFVQIAQLFATTAQDADALRAQLNLPKISPQPSSSPSPSHS